MRKISILGSTGSIGTQTLSVIEEQKDIKVVALSAGKNIELLEKQIRAFNPHIVSVADEDDAKKLKVATKDISNLVIMHGMEGLEAVATEKDAEVVVTAIVGMLGIKPTIAAINAGKDIALANKETLVCAGHIIMPLAAKTGVKIIPVDSEHSAIFQSLNGERANHINKILLTASGGAFRGMNKSMLCNVTVEQALKHPNWSMGKKVTIDSATLVNKGLEVIEAHWLFGVEPDKICVLIHPQSIVHSMVEYVDGAVIAQLGVPTMRLPIQYALYYPIRRPLLGTKLDLFDVAKLEFYKPDIDTFKGLKLAYDAINKGGNMPTIFNAANEEAVKLFLDNKIKFLDIYDVICRQMDDMQYIEEPTINQILDDQQMIIENINSQFAR